MESKGGVGVDMAEGELFARLDDPAALERIQADERLVQKLCACVCAGDVVAMEVLVWQMGNASQLGKFGATPLRHMQNLAIILTHNLKTAAVQGGAGHIRCSQLEEDFVRRIEACQGMEQVQALADEAKRRFCRLVYGQRCIGFEDPLLRAVMEYVADHCTEKLSLTQVAAVGLSREYLSRTFYTRTGQHLTGYIQAVKVRCAKKMLEETDASLAEIANYLSFSSQSYFQNVFRRVEGCSPGAYRRRVSRGRGLSLH